MTPQPSDDSKAIMTARLLGYGGLLPFLFLAGAVLFELRTPFAPASALLIGYGAIILSFVGALHWGAEFNKAKGHMRALAFLWSILPALLGWVALMMPVAIATSLLIAGLISCLLYDLKILKAGHWPSWMRALRLTLTLLACVSLSANYSLYL